MKEPSLRTEHGRKRAAIALTDNHDGLALAVLIAGEAAIAAVFAQIGWLHIAAEISGIMAQLPQARLEVRVHMAARAIFPIRQHFLFCGDNYIGSRQGHRIPRWFHYARSKIR